MIGLMVSLWTRAYIGASCYLLYKWGLTLMRFSITDRWTIRLCSSARYGQTHMFPLFSFLIRFISTKLIHCAVSSNSQGHTTKRPTTLPLWIKTVRPQFWWLDTDITIIRTGAWAIDQIFRVIWEQSQSSFDDDFNFVSYYNWTGGNGALSPAVNNDGNGEPKAYNGLVGTHHRPSDDLSTYGIFLTIVSKLNFNHVSQRSWRPRTRCLASSLDIWRAC